MKTLLETIQGIRAMLAETPFSLGNFPVVDREKMIDVQGKLQTILSEEGLHPNDAFALAMSVATFSLVVMGVPVDLRRKFFHTLQSVSDEVAEWATKQKGN